jgi:hypothetical protein
MPLSNACHSAERAACMLTIGSSSGSARSRLFEELHVNQINPHAYTSSSRQFSAVLCVFSLRVFTVYMAAGGVYSRVYCRVETRFISRFIDRSHVSQRDYCGVHYSDCVCTTVQIDKQITCLVRVAFVRNEHIRRRFSIYLTSIFTSYDSP